MGIAGIYRKWRSPEGDEMFSFSMLTVNANGHPLMQRFYRLGDEKRMVVILDPKDYDKRLSCPVKKAPKFFRQRSGTLLVFPKPLPGRTQSPNDATQPGLFSFWSVIRGVQPN
jgi:putative SOS response-associated peptidase YedK